MRYIGKRRQSPCIHTFWVEIGAVRVAPVPCSSSPEGLPPPRANATPTAAGVQEEGGGNFTAVTTELEKLDEVSGDAARAADQRARQLAVLAPQIGARAHAR